MLITLEIKNLKDWEILSPLLARLKIKVIDQPIISNKKKPSSSLKETPTTKDGVLQIAEILRKEAATTLETTTTDSKEIATDFFKSAGLFQHKEIDAKTLRQQAWKLKK